MFTAELNCIEVQLANQVRDADAALNCVEVHVTLTHWNCIEVQLASQVRDADAALDCIEVQLVANQVRGYRSPVSQSSS